MYIYTHTLIHTHIQYTHTHTHAHTHTHTHTKPLLQHPSDIIAERLSARHLILQHALGRCIFVRHALLSVTLLICPSRSIVRHAPYLAVTLYCPSRSSTHARKDGRGVTHVYARTSSRVGWTDGDGGGERVHARPNAWAFARALDGRRGTFTINVS